MVKKATATATAPAPARNAARQTTSSNAPAVSKAKSPDLTIGDDLASMMDEDSGRGVSQSSEDNIVPLIYILQSQSPQVLKQKAGEYIKGAEAGMLWFRGTKDIFDGENEGLLVQPVHFGKKWMEWQPNRGGLAGIHATRPEDAELKTDPKNPKKQYWELPSGNTVNEVRDHVVIVHGLDSGPAALVLPFTGSNHTASRSWMGLMNRQRTPKGNKAPSFGFMYRVRTVAKSNDQGDWFGLEVDNAGEDGAPMPVTDIEVYKMARQLAQDFESGAKKADVASDMGDDISASGTEGDDDKI